MNLIRIWTQAGWLASLRLRPIRVRRRPSVTGHKLWVIVRNFSRITTISQRLMNFWKIILEKLRIKKTLWMRGSLQESSWASSFYRELRNCPQTERSHNEGWRNLKVSSKILRRLESRLWTSDSWGLSRESGLEKDALFGLGIVSTNFVLQSCSD